MDVWELQLPHPIEGVQRVELCISPDFPAIPPSVYVDKKLCLIWPHVEETGKFCHGVEPSFDDYDNPIGAVRAVLERLEVFWQNTQDADWVSAEFHRERLSYWSRFCQRQAALDGGITPYAARVQFSPIDDVTQGKIAVYLSGNKTKRCTLLLATTGDTDPHSLATRHGWSLGTLQRGKALFVPLPDNALWTPQAWPTSIGQLDRLINQVTGRGHLLESWLRENSSESRQAFMVVLVQSNVCYGYLLKAAAVPGVTELQVFPIYLDRVDVTWALARDHQRTTLQRRRGVRVLVLGCGSLGSMVIEHLARAGVGRIDIVDREGFEAANCARHVLGSDSIDLSKTHEMASRLQRLVPGVQVNPHWVMAERWIPAKCRPGQYDVVLDLTGESSVRSLLVQYRSLAFAGSAILHGWMEPFCSAAHLIHLATGEDHPVLEPAQGVNVARWADGTVVQLAACGSGFHPYGSADVAQVAGFVSERCLAVIDASVTTSQIWSWIRSEAFFDNLSVDAVCGPCVPKTSNVFDSVHLTRSFGEVYGAS